MRKFLVYCSHGIEDIVIEEVRQLKPEAIVEPFFEIQGRLVIRNITLDQLRQLHSIYTIIELKQDIAEFDKTSNGIYEAIKQLEIPELKTASSFRVSSRRYGQHDFTSNDLQAMAGKALQENYQTPVSLKEYQYNIRIDVIAKYYFAGIEHEDKRLEQRFDRTYFHRAGLKPSMAYALLQLADIQDGDTVVDPFAGGGTLPLEAAGLYGSKIQNISGDLYSEEVAKAQENAALNNLDELIEFRAINVYRMEDFVTEPVDKIISNPPYGVKSATKSNIRKLYRVMLIKAATVLKDHGKMVLLMQRTDMFRELVLRTKLFKICHERVIEANSLHPHVFVLGKVDDHDME
ncbi:MAG: hypothetical protein BRD49_04150 [Bacteroidetes bacterium SW_10_40_5]|nr:MAG: hypothetical protein BRD49_04150 [Bacteroidetes bacterium SW_10_40_5]